MTLIFAIPYCMVISFSITTIIGRLAYLHGEKMKPFELTVIYFLTLIMQQLLIIIFLVWNL